MITHAQMALHMQQHEKRFVARGCGYIFCVPNIPMPGGTTCLIDSDGITLNYLVCPVCYKLWNSLNDKY